MARFLIVEARFYEHLNDMLIAGAKAALQAAGHTVDKLTVPGALELPGAIASAAVREEVTIGRIAGSSHSYFLVSFHLVSPRSGRLICRSRRRVPSM